MNVLIDYTNYAGVRRERVVRPIDGTLRFTSTEHHVISQWVFDAEDVERGVVRTFALGGVHSWRPAP